MRRPFSVWSTPARLNPQARLSVSFFLLSFPAFFCLCPPCTDDLYRFCTDVQLSSFTLLTARPSAVFLLAATAAVTGAVALTPAAAPVPAPAAVSLLPVAQAAAAAAAAAAPAAARCTTCATLPESSTMSPASSGLLLLVVVLLVVAGAVCLPTPAAELPVVPVLIWAALDVLPLLDLLDFIAIAICTVSSASVRSEGRLLGRLRTGEAPCSLRRNQ
jgi:hypothetical protein